MFSMVKFIEEMQHHSVQENSPSDAMTQYEQEGNCNMHARMKQVIRYHDIIL